MNSVNQKPETIDQKPAPDRGGWMQTYSGARFYPLDPRPEDVNLTDIAHALSHVCRFGGHCREFYSVAQHSVLVAWAAADLAVGDRAKINAGMWGLFHDAAEAYIGDMVRPLKVEMTSYQAIETRILEVIALRFGLCWPMPHEVKVADDILLATEARDLMGVAANAWHLGQAPQEQRIVGMPADVARDRFHWAYDKFQGMRAGG